MSFGAGRQSVMVMCVVGARPNFMKIAPILRRLEANASFAFRLVHTGQHYDTSMNEVFFRELDIPPPDAFLGVGSGSHVEQTAAVMRAVEAAVGRESPDLVLVVGDVNSTLAAALVAAKKGIPVAHVEAGLRSFDRSMPEEINRVLTDQLSEILFVTEEEGLGNLAREGIAADKVHLVGNVMIDTLLQSLERARPAAAVLGEAGADTRFLDRSRQGYALATLHRPSSVDHPDTLRGLLRALRETADRLCVAFPVHPRTAKAMREAGLDGLLEHPSLLRLPPLPYLSMVGLMREARVVLTDSGGIQEETTGLGIPCLTLRKNTERPITVTQGTNQVVGVDREDIVRAIDEILATGGKRGKVPPLWDGKAAERIVGHLESRFVSASPTGRLPHL